MALTSNAWIAYSSYAVTNTDGGQPVHRHCFEHLKAVEIRHLDVEEHEIRTVLHNGGDGLTSARTLAHDRYITLGG
jgi:hypothetical protein